MCLLGRVSEVVRVQTFSGRFSSVRCRARPGQPDVRATSRRAGASSTVVTEFSKWGYTRRVPGAGARRTRPLPEPGHSNSSTRRIFPEHPLVPTTDLDTWCWVPRGMGVGPARWRCVPQTTGIKQRVTSPREAGTFS